MHRGDDFNFFDRTDWILDLYEKMGHGSRPHIVNRVKENSEYRIKQNFSAI